MMALDLRAQDIKMSHQQHYYVCMYFLPCNYIHRQICGIIVCTTYKLEIFLFMYQYIYHKGRRLHVAGITSALT